jgi:hypothetical protein
MNKSNPPAGAGDAGRGPHEKTEETNSVATPELDDQSGHARQEIGEAVFAAAREPGKVA